MTQKIQARIVNFSPHFFFYIAATSCCAIIYTHKYKVYIDMLK